MLRNALAALALGTTLVGSWGYASHDPDRVERVALIVRSPIVCGDELNLAQAMAGMLWVTVALLTDNADQLGAADPEEAEARRACVGARREEQARRATALYAHFGAETWLGALAREACPDGPRTPDCADALIDALGERRNAELTARDAYGDALAAAAWLWFGWILSNIAVFIWGNRRRAG